MSALDILTMVVTVDDNGDSFLDAYQRGDLSDVAATNSAGAQIFGSVIGILPINLNNIAAVNGLTGFVVAVKVGADLGNGNDVALGDAIGLVSAGVTVAAGVAVAFGAAPVGAVYVGALGLTSALSSNWANKKKWTVHDLANDLWNRARSWFRRDPLALDLNGNGIETVGAAGTNVVLFDHDGDGIKTGTGWVQASDGLLVLDKNGNGTIDNGAELFGIDTVLANGQKAANGFAALADLDTNHDGVFNASDAAYTQVRLWQDLNQDGISQAGELATLSALGITGINLNPTAANQALAGGNLLDLQATFTRSDGSTGTAGALNLVENPFYRQYPDGTVSIADNPFNQPTSGGIVLTPAAQALPDMHGSGAVHDLREAASLDGGLAASVQGLMSAGLQTRASLMASLDGVINQWAGTSNLSGSQAVAHGLGYELHYLPAGMNPLELKGPGATGTPGAMVTPEQRAAWEAKMAQVARAEYLIGVLEKFNGATFVNVEAGGVRRGNGQFVAYTTEVDPNAGGMVSHQLYLSLDSDQLTLLEQSYRELKASLYQGLVLETRLKPFLDDVGLSIGQDGIHADFGFMEARLNSEYANDRVNAFVDRLELSLFAGTVLGQMGWDGEGDISRWVAETEANGQWGSVSSQLNNMLGAAFAGGGGLVAGDATNDSLYGTSGTDALLGASGNDTLVGYAGDDLLYGGDGNDGLKGGVGNDTLDGGSGNDLLYGGSGNTNDGLGNDTYLFGRGDGNDTIYDQDAIAGNTDTIRFKAGVASTDVLLSRPLSNVNSLLLSIDGTTDSVRVADWFYGGTANRIERVEFADGTVWDVAKLLTAPITGTAGSDVWTGTSDDDYYDGADGADSINGAAGNDVLFGGNGNDILKGAEGSDRLYGGAGDDVLGVWGDGLEWNGCTVVDGVRMGNCYDGGPGDDTMYASRYADTYIYRRGDGRDRINEEGTPTDVDTLDLQGDILPSDVILVRTGNDLVLNLVGTSDSVVQVGYFADLPGTYQVEKIKFANGAVWGQADVYARFATCGTMRDDVLTALPNLADRLYGLEGNDVLTGSSGNDVLDGGIGADSLAGRLGDDLYVVDDAADAVTENAGEGQDTVQSAITFTLGADVENLTLTGGATINGTGNALDNILIGNSAANVLEGKAGNDTYYVGAGDTVNEGVNAGSDTVVADVTWTLGANLENLILTGTGAINGTGNTLDNVVVGNGAANSLNGASGRDTMIGGGGDDIYYVDNSGDQIVEQASGGYDRLYTLVSASLPINVEGGVIYGSASGLVLSGGDGDDALTISTSASGNNHRLEGGAGSDTLTGGNNADLLSGGTGTDILRGGAGNDSLVGDAPGELETDTQIDNLVVYAKGTVVDGGYPMMEVWVGGVKVQTFTVATESYAAYAVTVPLGINAREVAVAFTNDAARADLGQDRNLFVDKIVINGRSWTGNGTGVLYDVGAGAAAFDDISVYASSGGVWSNGSLRFRLSGNDLLDGGVGADSLIGGVGNDIYGVDDAGDSVVEVVGGGHDLVRSAIDYTLGDELEDLQLVGSANLNAWGNALNNTLTGNAGVNRLDGGAGKDLMVGGAGDDTFVVDNAGDGTSEYANQGYDTVESTISWTLWSNTEKLVLTGGLAINGAGNALDNVLVGNAAANTLNGAAGNDILQGGGGNDTLTDQSGSALLDGGTGADTLTGGAAAEVFVGGAGNDTLVTASGNDVVLFNKGDGQDAFASGGSGNDSLSLGGGIAYGDLLFSKSGVDLVLKTGATDQITFKAWYAVSPDRPVVRLQVIAEAMAGFVQGGGDPLRDQRVEGFDFAGLVGAFDAALTANPGLTGWALANALANFQLAGSDSAAMGGDLAYQYGRNGSFAGIGVGSALGVLADSGLGTNLQTLAPVSVLQAGSVRLV